MRFASVAALGLVCVVACADGTNTVANDLPISFDWRAARGHVDVLTDDALGGRAPDTPGSAQARAYIIGELMDAGVSPFGLDDAWTTSFVIQPTEDDSFALDAEGHVVAHAPGVGVNIIGVIPGADPTLSHQHIVLMAHYDHLGVTRGGEVFNGAIDNASAVALLIELGRSLVALDEPMGRSVVLLITDAEERGLTGAEAWLESTPVPVEDIVIAVSVDPVGRRLLPDYGPIVLIGSERSAGLREELEQAADGVSDPVVFLDREVLPLFASDHDVFFRHDIPLPAVWFTNPGMSFYHSTRDTAETVDYRILSASADLLSRYVMDLARSNTRYEYVGPRRLGAAAARDAQQLVQGVLTSEELEDDERELALGLAEDFSAIEAADDMSAVDNEDTFILGALAFLVGRLPSEHIGPIPPPTPDE